MASTLVTVYYCVKDGVSQSLGFASVKTLVMDELKNGAPRFVLLKGEMNETSTNE